MERPRAQEALRELEPLFTIIYPALDAAADFAVRYHDAHKRAVIDPYLYSSLVRDYLRESVREADLASTGFAVRELQNLGLEFSGEHYRLRIKKAGRNGELWVPGASRRLREYFEQPALFEAMLPNIGRTPLNLLAVWEADGGHQLAGLDLMCPRKVDAKDVVLAYWRTPVPPPLGPSDAVRERPPDGPKPLGDDLDLGRRQRDGEQHAAGQR